MTAASGPTPSLERRRERRVPVHLPMLVRGTDRSGAWFEERTSSEDLCRGGAAFATRYAVDLGMRLEISILSGPSASEPDAEFSTHGRIVHLKPAKHDPKFIVAFDF